MVGEVLKRIIEAETEAANFLKDAEKQVRKIEERNYADIQKMRDDMNMDTNKIIKALEQEALGSGANITASVATPSNQKMREAKDFIVNSIIGGAS